MMAEIINSKCGNKLQTAQYLARLVRATQFIIKARDAIKLLARWATPQGEQSPSKQEAHQSKLIKLSILNLGLKLASRLPGVSRDLLTQSKSPLVLL
jgi:hypothetical protein